MQHMQNLYCMVIKQGAPATSCDDAVRHHAMHIAAVGMSAVHAERSICMMCSWDVFALRLVELSVQALMEEMAEPGGG